MRKSPLPRTVAQSAARKYTPEMSHLSNALRAMTAAAPSWRAIFAAAAAQPEGGGVRSAALSDLLQAP